MARNAHMSQMAELHAVESQYVDALSPCHRLATFLSGQAPLHAAVKSTTRRTLQVAC
jgi:hypothetical protein